MFKFCASIKNKSRVKNDKNAYLYLRLAINGKGQVKYIPLQITLPLNAWGNSNETVNKEYRNSAKINKQLSAIKKKYEDAAYKLLDDAAFFSLEEWTDAVTCSEITVKSIFDEIIQEKSQQTRIYKTNVTATSKKTADNYQSTANSLLKFCVATADKYGYCWEAITFEQFDRKFCKNYSNWLDNKSIKAGKSINGNARTQKKTSINRVLKIAILRGVDADLNGWEQFRSYKSDNKKSSEKCITHEDYCKIVNYANTIKDEEERLCADLFLITCTTGGLAPVDVVHLQWCEFKVKEGIAYLPTKRRKTGNPQGIPLCQESINIFIRYAIENQNPNDFIFKNIMDDGNRLMDHWRNKVNDWLKTISENLELSACPKWYWGRHYAITRLFDEGYSIDDVCVICGSSRKVVDAIYRNRHEDMGFEIAKRKLMERQGILSIPQNTNNQPILFK